MGKVVTVHSVEELVRTVEDVMLEGSGKGRWTRSARPHHKRVWASLRKSVKEMVEEMVEEMTRRDPGKEKVWVVLMDGERTLRDKVREVLGPKLRGRHIEILDLYHVIEHLWKVSHALHGKKARNKKTRKRGKKKGKKRSKKGGKKKAKEKKKVKTNSKEAEDFVTFHLRRLLEGDVKKVIEDFRQMVTEQDLKGKKKKELLDCANYFDDRTDMMRYDVFLAMGLPIATGVVEGACKNLIKDRFERSGMRWTVNGAEAMLRMRATDRSGDLDEYWRFHREADCQRLYGRKWEVADGPIHLNRAMAIC
jgi:hypothetical protein